MKKQYSDPLMFSNILLSTVEIGPSQGGSGTWGTGSSSDDSQDITTPVDQTSQAIEPEKMTIQLYQQVEEPIKNITEENVKTIMDDYIEEESVGNTESEIPDVSE